MGTNAVSYWRYATNKIHKPLIIRQLVSIITHWNICKNRTVYINIGYLSVVCLLEVGLKLLLNRKPLYFDEFFVQIKTVHKETIPPIPLCLANRTAVGFSYSNQKIPSLNEAGQNGWRIRFSAFMPSSWRNKGVYRNLGGLKHLFFAINKLTVS